jgi:ABC-2 type transport system ATP-binding protein
LSASHAPSRDEPRYGAALEATNASLSFRDLRALDQVSLRIAPGEVYALVGPNGAGKSTFIKAACGQAPLNGGTIMIGGAPAGSAAARRRIGLAPQRPALFDRLTAEENVDCFARLAGVSNDVRRERVQDAMALTRLEGASRKTAHCLSGGLRQRVNIAAAIVHMPALLILDEPAAALDHAGLADANAVIENVRSRHIAVLLVTHDMAQAEACADRVGVLCAGRMIGEGAPEAIKARLGDQLAVTVTTLGDHAAETILRERGFSPIAPRRWRGAAAHQREVAALAEALSYARAPVQAIEAARPSLADAVAALIADAAPFIPSTPAAEERAA